MDRISPATLCICFTLLGLVAVGGVGAVSQDTTVGDVQGESSVIDTDSSSVEIDQALRNATGEVEVIVSLPEIDRTLGPSGLQAHARVTQQPLLRFAEARSGVSVENTFWLTNAALVTVDTSMVSLSDLAAIDGVQALHENMEVTVDVGVASGVPAVQTPGIDSSNYTYGLEQINAPTAWNTHNTTGAGASVAVLDTGVDGDHPDLDVAKWQEFDGNGNPVDSQPNDGDGHGTHVSGTVSGSMSPDGDVPAYGVAPDVDLYGVKVLDDDGYGSFAQIIAGMEWAVQEDADIISMSLGAPGFYDQMIDPVQNAVNNGTIVVASSGNSGEGSSGSPGNVYDSIAVGMSNESLGIDSDSSGEVVDTQSDWSSPPSDWPDEYTVPSIAAPGVKVLSSVPGGGYDDTYSGTSMAAPHVSGAVALAESALERSLSATEVEEALEQTAFKPSDAPAPPGERDTRYGSGIIDAEAFVTFLQGAFVISEVSTDAPVVEGKQLNVTAMIKNTDDIQDTQTINLSVGGLGTDTTSVTLGGGNSTNATLSVGTAAGDAGEYTATVTSADDSATANATVLAPAEFTVDIAETNTPVEGETLNVTAAVDNTGDIQNTQTVDLSVGALGTDSTSVTLDGGNSTSMTLSVGTGAGDAGEYTATVTSEDDSATANATVLAPAEFTVDIVETNTPVEGETLNVTAAIENTGDIQDTQTVDLSVGALGSGSTSVTLGGGNSTNVTLSVGTGAGDAGEYTATVSTEDDSATANATVLAEAAFSVSNVNATTPVGGEILTVTAEIENVGDVAGTQTVTLNVSGLGSNATVVTLGGEASTEVALLVPTGAGDAGTYNATVATENQTVELTVEVFLPSLPGEEDRPSDLDDDNLYEDVDGDGTFDIFDVQVFFDNYNKPVVQNNAELFDFDDDGDIDIFDVQALFENL